MSKIYYIAYGSNLEINFLKRLCPSMEFVGVSCIRDYALMFRGTGNNYAYLTPERRDGASFPVAVFLIEEEDISQIDVREGYPYLYDKEYIEVFVEEKPIQGLIYVMHDKYQYAMPSVNYVITCSRGYKELGFDSNILVNAIMETDQEMRKMTQKNNV